MTIKELTKETLGKTKSDRFWRGSAFFEPLTETQPNADDANY
jgi:hypothetical protein